MRVVIAPDKFKGSLSALEVCLAIENGIKKFDSSIETIKHPLADGGEGTLDILQNYFELKTVSLLVKDPLFRDITATYMVSEDTAYIEMSNASGLQLLREEEKNCCNTTTFGTGQLILDAVQKGFKNIVLFIGGSATNDAGIGMATALGYQFYNADNKSIEPIGKSLLSIHKIENDKLLFTLSDINFTVVCDVKNPLYGPNGAAYVYGGQKGASSEEIETLDLGLQNFSKQVSKYLHKEVAEILGAGAAGGLGAGAVCFLNATIKSGIDFVMEQTGFDALLKDQVDLIITGEGSVDKQTIEGKVIKGISERAIQNNIPFSIISGIVKDEKLIQENLHPKSIASIMELGVTTADAMKNAALHINGIAHKLIKEHKAN
ncbi:glycerate kinase [Flavobacterium degerlachei]|jgi:glycerate kinase|uniref:Glycerate kinase n=1 Tax=Flavobacterium degerlachei TaxID=229203 RepID=A0A1H2R3R1_9FLAO|nr:glycerate kinase [Flavobacterium degerlachei]SDW14102.1 glycerate kinase [Flavobacterium degerlachei]